MRDQILNSTKHIRGLAQKMGGGQETGSKRVWMCERQKKKGRILTKKDIYVHHGATGFLKETRPAAFWATKREAVVVESHGRRECLVVRKEETSKEEKRS